MLYGSGCVERIHCVALCDMDVFAGLVAALIAFLTASYHDALLRVAPQFLPPATPASAMILFGGDMMFDRTIHTITLRKGSDFLFSCIDPLLLSQDLVVANLEGPISPNTSLSVFTVPGDANNMTFTFPLSTGALLYKHNVRMMNIGNNHSNDFGRNGMYATVNYLIGAHVEYFGDTIAHRMTPVEVGGVPVTFINYNEFAISDTEETASTTIAQIKIARSAEYIPVVYTHWGIEYQPTAPSYVRERAHEFIDAGAEIVIGSHPHVVEDHEVYKGKYIYYSLGNFIFDQYFTPEVSHGLLLQTVFTPKGVQSVKEIPIQLNRDGTTCVVE